MNDWVVFGLLWGLGLFLFICGLMVHLKRWLRLLALNDLFPGQLALAMTWLGAWMMTVPLAEFIPEGTAKGLLGIFSFALLAAGLVGTFWYPMFLRPRWMRRDAELQARGEDLFAKRFLQGQGKPSDGQHP